MKIERWQMAITYTLQKAAEESGLSMRTLQYAIGRGELESLQVGRRRLIPARSLEQFLLAKKRPATRQAKRG
jgi:excisionase family DNA binding protein